MSKFHLITKLFAHPSVNKTSVRFLNLLEYQSKRLLQKNNVAIQKFCIVDDNDYKALNEFNAPEYVVKAQILAGGRGKGHFSNGFKGGVHLTKNHEEVNQLVSKMLGYNLITKQTPPQGIRVNHVMVAESVNIKRETYVCILMDRSYNGPVLIASPAGGVDIEAVAEKQPHLIKRVPIDIYEGISLVTCKEIAEFLEFKGPLVEKAAIQLQNLWQLFIAVDAVQVEINPLVETDNQKVIAVDAKIGFDDNAEFRQKDIFALGDSTESDPREVEASKHNLNYIGMHGNIGCLVNGAGLAMATMDIIKLNGGEPANFLDVGGNVQEHQVLSAFKILCSDKNVSSILVNVFGGIVNCATIANGIVVASKTLQLSIPLVVRLEGNNVEEAQDILNKSGLPIQIASDLDEAAKKAIKSLPSF